ncbi:MAG: hypothetical protein Q4C70_05060 [Planctomycetia bacterium]|nr:hypothetical protein [Planctomycetia bacterium]
MKNEPKLKMKLFLAPNSKKEVSMLRNRRKGILTFEWILLITLLVIGIVGGLTVMRDSIIIECAETADAMLHHDHSYHIEPSLKVTLYTSGGTIIVNGEADSSDEKIPVYSGYSAGSEFIDYSNAVQHSHVTIRTPQKETSTDNDGFAMKKETNP